MNRPLYIVLTILFFFSYLANNYTQTNLENTLARANKHIQDAERYSAEMKYIKAKESYQFAARLYRDNNLPAYYAICYNGIGNTYIDLTLYEEAKSKGFEKALQQLAEIKSIDPHFDVDSSLVADAYEGLGRYYSNISSTLQTKEGTETKIHYEKALEYHRMALRIRQKFYGNEHQKIALSYYFIGQCYRGFSTDPQRVALNPIQKELEYLEKALEIQLKTIGEIHYQTANTYQALGNYFYETQKDYHKGFQYHKKAFEIRQELFNNNHLQIASSYIDMAIYYQVMNMYDKELSYLEKALQIQLSILGTEHTKIARSYYLLATRYRNNGSIKKALSYYEYALAIFIKRKHKQSLEAAEVRLGLALCYRALHETEQEYQQLEQSQKIYEQILGKKHFKIGLVLLEKGDYYLQEEKYDSSLYFYKKALVINQQQLGEVHHDVAYVYDKITYVYRLKQNTDKEFEYLMLSLELKKNNPYLNIDDNFNLSSQSNSLTFMNHKIFRNKTLAQELYNSYMNLASFYYRTEDYLKALQFIQQGLAAVCPSISNQTINIYTNPSTKDLSHNIHWLYALQQKATLFLQLYHNKGRKKDLNAAIETYTQGISVINSLRTNFSSKKAQKELQKYSIPIYEGAITALYNRYVNTKDTQYLNKAFEITEYSKSFALIQGLQNTLARGNSNIPDKLLALETQLRRRLAYYSNYQNRGAKNNQKFDKIYFNTKQSYDSLISNLEKNYPTYYNLKYQNKVATIDQVCAQLLKDNRHLLLEYFIGDQYIFVFKISKNKKEFFQILIPENYETLVYNLRSSLTNYDMIGEHPQWAYQAFVTASYKFYKQFLAPFIQADNDYLQLTIIPDGMLNYIPFEVLIDQEPSKEEIKSRDYKNLAFILKKHPINYNYSATLWIDKLQKRTLNNNGKCLGFAPSIQLDVAQDSLPWTQKELEAIQNIFDGEYYFGAEANKTLFKETASDFSIIHLATHGIVNMENPMRSLLSFAALSDSSHLDEVALYAYEIHNLSLQADLVVLSACETGFGKAIRGEGVLSLARAFIYAGAPSVVTTLWEVNDFTSAALIETFYSNLSKGMNKPMALQQAKLTFLSKTDEISGHPTYWASFITIGNSSPIKQQWSWMKFLAIGLCLFVTGYGILRYYQKKASS